MYSVKKYKRFLKKLVFIAAIVMLFTAQSVLAATAQNDTISEKGLQVYVIPNGANGTVSGNFWVYAEMIGEKNEPYISEDWTIQMTIYHRESDSTVTSENLQLSSQQNGYILKGLTLVGDYQYKDYELTVTIKAGEEVVAEKKAMVSNLLVNWPNLMNTSWESELKFTEDAAGMKRSVVFDWKNMSLFNRLFQVKIEENLDQASVEVVEAGIWEITLADAVQGDVLFHLVDEAGNSQDYTYRIEVIQQSLPIELFALIIFLLVLIVIIVVTVFFKNRPKEEKIKGSCAGTEQKMVIIQIKQDMNKAHTDLETSKKQWKDRKKEYKKLLEEAEKILDEQPEAVQYLDDLRIFRTSPVSGAMKDYENTENQYQKAVNELINYISNYAEWSRDSSAKSQEYMEIIRDLQDVSKSISKEAKVFNEKKEELSKYKNEVYEKKQELERPLGMSIWITVKIGADIYKINTAADKEGFVLDERRPLYKHIMTNETLEQLVGASSDIRIAACKGKPCVILDCTSEGLYYNGQVVKKMEIQTGAHLKFDYFYSNDKKAEITIMTN